MLFLFTGDESDIFFIGLELEWPILPPYILPTDMITQEDIQVQLQQLEGLIRSQLEIMPMVESLKWITALPTLTGQGKNQYTVMPKGQNHGHFF